MSANRLPSTRRGGALRALLRKELAVLFGSPIAYVVLTMVTFVTAFVFFEHLRAYNQILFLYATTTMGGFESGTVPTHVNLRDTVSCDLNVLGEAGPKIPPQFQDSKYVFLANTHPALQIELLAQLEGASLVVADTMDLWINTEREMLVGLLSKIDGLVLNDSEAVLLTGKSNIVQAGMECAAMVKKFVVVKKGEHGSLLFVDGKVYPLPGYPTENVVDPTGAGDSFAGGMMGYIAEQDAADPATLLRAIAYGTIVASIELEDFSLNRFTEIQRSDIDARFAEFKELISF